MEEQHNPGRQADTPRFQGSNAAFALYRQWRLLRDLRKRSRSEAEELSRMIGRQGPFREDLYVNGKRYHVSIERRVNYMELLVYPFDGPSPD